MGGLVWINGFFEWLWQASWEAAIVSILVLLSQWLLGKWLTPRWRRALWFLVVIRLALPGSIQSRISVFNLLQAPSLSALGGPPGQMMGASAGAGEARSAPGGALDRSSGRFGSWISLRSVWLAGAVSLWCCFLASGWQLGRGIRRQRPVTNEALLNLLEDCKREMGVFTPLTLLETSRTNSPALLGFIRPRLLLPEGLIQSFSPAELRFVFLHELGHLKRGDILVNWLLTVPLVLHWFNPMVWYAVRQIRIDGESACDAAALSHAQEGENRLYGQTIIKLLERFSAPARGPGLVGVLEQKNQMKARIELIARFKKQTPWPLVAASLFVVLALLTLTNAQSQWFGTGAQAQRGGSAMNAYWRPWIIAASPAPGESEVDPALSEITITFDRDMLGGMSWTGRESDYPPTPEGRPAYWRNQRTCVLPVKLQPGHFYRVDINPGPPWQNFRGTDGRTAAQAVLYFTTQRADQSIKARLTRPKAVSFYPPNGAIDVDRNLKELRVTFDLPMWKGYSWTGGGDNYPASDGKTPYWVDDRTCVLPVTLEPGHQYSLGINSIVAVNFQSADGRVPASPVEYSFRTK